MNIDADTVRKVAQLSSLALEDNEIEQYQVELSKVLNFVEQLDALPLATVAMASDAEKVENPVTATISANSLDPFRPDSADMPLSRDTLMANAPEVENGAYVVPNIL
ncbi:MAG: Asp-tRNA(Asn)/Glu-tRNA(Gln) amidotransferase subunit GatC [Vampirovibrio sp.]